VSPTARTLQFLRSAGITCQVVEKWNPHAKVRQDLFGCIDIIALINEKIVGIQVTSDSNHAARARKASEEPRVWEWVGAGGWFVVWSWGKKGERGKRKTWTMRLTNMHGEPCNVLEEA
jgi:hypothetical protein